MRAVDKSDLTRWQSLQAAHVLKSLADYVKVDTSFNPVSSHATTRVHVCVAGGEWELLLTGTKFFDTRAEKGGGGAVDLVMHLWRVPFRQAARLLKDCGL